MAGRGRTALGAAFGAALGLAGLAWPDPAHAAPREGRAAAQQQPRAQQQARAPRPARGQHHARRPTAPQAQRAPAHAVRPQKGEASVYSTRLSGRTMADGTRFDPRSDAAASKTLPLGTTARVTNLENGRTTVVTIQDRGPHVRGRILDVSPKHARRLGIGEEGTAPVAVVPIRVPVDGAAPDRRAARR